MLVALEHYPVVADAKAIGTKAGERFGEFTRRDVDGHLYTLTFAIVSIHATAL